jgi:hypothetical protein
MAKSPSLRRDYLSTEENGISVVMYFDAETLLLIVV